MAKKKRTKKKTFAAGLSGILACCCIVLLLHDSISFQGGQTSHIPDAAIRETADEKPEIPQLIAPRKEQIIYHEGYTVSYNPEYKIANWVAYELTKEEVAGKVKRSDKFLPDPMIAQDETATNEDYRQSGYDKGHLAPAGDMKWSLQAMQESFYFTNICPQNKSLNTGIWNALEMQCRKWATHYGSVLIITGPVIENNLKRLGKHRVGIPNAFYKIICIPSEKKPKGIGFLFENKNYIQTSIRSMTVPIDSVEQVTGIDFFPSFPLEIQEEMESASEWI
ncbi:MAG: DNA/RNA non-specific endonuclease [Tannerellaceae bacterium]|jgi:endonuclease G|nr:DNA/RNA non-specific endonuclease [Tannerellaceae bacterium]